MKSAPWGQRITFTVMICLSLLITASPAGCSTAPGGETRIFLLSSDVAGGEQLIDTVRENVRVIRYDAVKDDLSRLLDRIREKLNGGKAASIALVTHGISPGRFFLTRSEVVSVETLAFFRTQHNFWRDLGGMCRADGRIDILACWVADGDAGEALVNHLEWVTGVSVAASTDATGNISAGGDWVLEAGEINIRETYYDARPPTHYPFVLACGPKQITLTPLASSRDEGQKAQYTVSSSCVDNVPSVVTLAFGGTATSNADYDAPSTTVHLPPWYPQVTVDFNLLVDDIYEGATDVLEVRIVSVSGAPGIFCPDTSWKSIQINESLPKPTVSLSVDSEDALLEDQENTRSISANLSHGSVEDISIGLSVSGDADRSTDYTVEGAQWECLSFRFICRQYGYSITIEGNSSGSNRTGTLSVRSKTDEIDEENVETATFSIYSQSNASKGTPDSVNVQIQDDDEFPVVSINSASVTEGSDGGTKTLTFTVSLNTESGRTVTVPFTSEDDTATSGDDYTLVTGSPLVFAAGQTSKSITVNIAKDDLDEENEQFKIDLEPTETATINTGTGGTGTIIDDDGPPTVAFTTASQSKMEYGGTMQVTAELTAPSGKEVSIPFSLSGTAEQNEDYTISPTTITIPAGVTTGSTTITLENDALYENDETVILTMGTPVNAGSGSPTTHTATINNDDPVPTVSFTIGTQSGDEDGASMSITAHLSAASGLPVTVPFTIDTFSTASQNDDFTIAPGALEVTIPKGSQNATITVVPIADGLDEPDETLILVMGTTANAGKGTISTHTITIVDKDNPPSVALLGNGGMTEAGSYAQVTAKLNQISGNDVTVHFGFEGTSAIIKDYTVSNTSVTIQAGETQSEAITLTPVDDDIDEGYDFATYESVKVSIDSVDNGNAVWDGNDLVLSIVDNDTAGIQILDGKTIMILYEPVGSDTFDFSLKTKPVSDVAVSLESSDTSECTVLPSTFTIIPNEWETRRTVTVTASDDAVIDDTTNKIRIKAESAGDQNYQIGFSDYVTVHVNEMTPCTDFSVDTVYPTYLQFGQPDTLVLTGSGLTGVQRIVLYPYGDIDNLIEATFQATDTQITLSGLNIPLPDGYLPGPYDYNMRLYCGDTSFLPVDLAVTVTDHIPTYKAVIVAGLDEPGSSLWPPTRYCAHYAFKTLKDRGFFTENIYYLGPESDDIDGDGTDDGFDSATEYNLKNVLLNEVNDPADPYEQLVIYFVGHGGTGTFRINPSEVLDADAPGTTEDLRGWLDDLQDDMTGELIFIYDACNSGSFLTRVNDPRRIVVSGAGDHTAYFFHSEDPLFHLSFSNSFWSRIYGRHSVWQAFSYSQSIMGSYQTPGLDANGNGMPDEWIDQNLTQSFYIGKEGIPASDVPIIADITAQLNPSETEISFAAPSVVDDDGISVVYALVTTPCWMTGADSGLIAEVPMVPVPGTDGYTGVFSDIETAGDYKITVLAIDTKGMVCAEAKDAVVFKNSGGGCAEVGDLNQNGAADLADAIIILRVLSGLDTTGQVPAGYESLGIDADGDGKVGLPEVVHVLGRIASP